MVKFFKQIELTYKPNTLWVIYRYINARFIDEYGKNLKHLSRFCKHLKQVTQLYVATKSATFTPEEIHKVLHSLQDSSDEKMTLCRVAIALLYYGLLRCSEVRKIRIKDIQIVTEKDDTFIEVNFKYQRKQRKEGFTNHISSSFVPFFRNYMRQIFPKTVESGNLQFLKNWNVCKKRCIQNTGKHMIAKPQAITCNILNKPDNNYTSHTWRGSAATNLADAGVSLVNLKRHGQ